MIAKGPRIRVTSRSFSRHPLLTQELIDLFPDTVFNPDGPETGLPNLVEFLSDADGVILGLEILDRALLKQLKNLKIVSTDPARGLILVSGGVPGSDNSYVLIKDSVKKAAPDGLPMPAALLSSGNAPVEEAQSEEAAADDAAPAENADASATESAADADKKDD